ncbi:MAG: ATP-binding cassette domain-containing protein [Planctomycetota bacterium]
MAAETTMTTTAAKRPASPSGAGPAVAVQGLTKVFKDFWMRDRARAVDGVTFQIERGEVFGLLGPNGSGKSTTIKMLLGLLRPTSGRIAVYGKPPTDVKTKKRIGYLPEESYLYAFLDARETLDYYGKLFQLDPRTRKQRTEELLDMVGLRHAASRPVRDYSKGMQRRIGIAQALINDPDLLILDEPTTGLDPIGTRQVKDLIVELGRRGKTVLLSSHLLADVEDVVDRMVILYGGKIRDEGTCEALLADQARTTIEADELDDETLTEIDRIIRERSNGQRSVLRVSKPRQKLEELFLDIVQRAQTERLATSGAVHEGSTASFLKGDGPEHDDGDAVIDRLMSDDALPPAAVDEGDSADANASGDSAPESTSAESSGLPDEGAITALLEPEPTSDRASESDGGVLDAGDPDSGDQHPANHGRPSMPSEAPDGDTSGEASGANGIDSDVIGSLLDGSEPDVSPDNDRTRDGGHDGGRDR